MREHPPEAPAQEIDTGITVEARRSTDEQTHDGEGNDDGDRRARHPEPERNGKIVPLAKSMGRGGSDDKCRGKSSQKCDSHRTNAHGLRDTQPAPRASHGSAWQAQTPGQDYGG